MGSVLVIERNRSLRQLIAEALQKEGFSVFAADDIYAGISQSEGKEIDIAIAPAEDPRAVAVIQPIRHTHPRAKIILAAPFDPIGHAKLPAGCVFMRVPFTLTELVKLVRDLGSIEL